MLEDILKEREKTHGEFREVARTSQHLKLSLLGVSYLSDIESEALEMILHKIARIIHGNPEEKDHWIDIQGYCQLVINTLK